MMRAALIIGAMYAFAALCLVLSRWLKSTTWPGRLNQFVGVSVGSFATGLVFLVVYTVLFPQENAAARALREARLANARADSLSARVDSLARRMSQ